MVPWWNPEEQTKEYQDTLEFSKAAANNPNRGAFGRFSGRPDEIYTWNELVVKHWFDRHGIENLHNVSPRVLLRDVMFDKRMEFDFWLPRLVKTISVDPGFHFKSYHPTTRRVMVNDDVKEALAERHGIETIHLIAYDDANLFASEVENKLGRLLP